MTLPLPRYALVVAGGRGIRMQLGIPKQFVLVAGKPLLVYALEAFYRCASSIRIIIVLPEAEIATWKTLCQQYGISAPHEVVAGGATRSASVYCGLQHISNHHSLVAVHDGVRPFVTSQLIENSFQQAALHGSAVASVPLKDSIRKVVGDRSEACEREKYHLIQTPQTFRTDLLWDAYEVSTGKAFSDDASVIEHSGHRVHLIKGDYSNLKVTTPEDLVIAEALVARAASAFDQQ